MKNAKNWLFSDKLPARRAKIFVGLNYSLINCQRSTWPFCASRYFSRSSFGAGLVGSFVEKRREKSIFPKCHHLQDMQVPGLINLSLINCQWSNRLFAASVDFSLFFFREHITVSFAESLNFPCFTVFFTTVDAWKGFGCFFVRWLRFVRPVENVAGRGKLQQVFLANFLSKLVVVLNLIVVFFNCWKTLKQLKCTTLNPFHFNFLDLLLKVKLSELL